MPRGSAFKTGLHIALLANGLFPYRVGGMQKHTTCLARHLPDTGTRVDVYYVADQKHPAAGIIHEELFASHENVRVHAVKAPTLPYFPGHYYLTCFWQSYWLYRELCRSKMKYDFIYAQGYTGWYSMLARQRNRAKLPPIGVHAHGINALQERFSLWRLFKHSFAPLWQRMNIRLADKNISLGGKLDDLIVASGAERSTILPGHNGIDSAWLRPFCEIQEPLNRVRFVFVGRDTRVKGFRELNDVVERLRNEPRFEIHLAGNIAPSRRVSARNVVYHDEVRDEQELRALYRHCDVLVCPSYSEGMPTVILEAMASGLTVIATDVGAVRLLVDDKSGWLIPAKDSEALAEAMRSAMQEPVLAKKLEGRRRVEDFTWEKVVRTFVDQLNAHLALQQPQAHS